MKTAVSYQNTVPKDENYPILLNYVGQSDVKFIIIATDSTEHYYTGYVIDKCDQTDWELLNHSDRWVKGAFEVLPEGTTVTLTQEEVTP